MAFGTGSNSFGPNVQLYSFKIKSKDLPEPIFEVTKKGADGKYGDALTDKVTRVNGTVIGVQHKENQFEGKTIKSVNVTLRDKDDVYFVSVGYTFLGRNILNSLLALSTFDDIEIGLYQSKPKPDAVDKRGFASASVRQNGNMVYGRFKKEELPEIPKVKINGQTMSDCEAIDGFFAKHIVELAKTVKAATQAAEDAAEANEDALSTGAGGGPIDGDSSPDRPF